MSTLGSLFTGQWQFFDDNGVPLAGGTVQFYAAGTTTPQNTYTTSALSVANANPVQLDSAGRPQSTDIFLDPTLAYKWVVKDSSGVTQTNQNVDNYYPSQSATQIAANGQTFNDNVAVTFGTGGDSTILYDGTDLVVNSAVVGSGTLSLTKGQLTFPATQNPSSGVNVLDDYEEGSWTPVIGGSGGTSGQTYTTQNGRYVKIGKLVVAIFSATLSAKGTITTSLQIQGLPFTVGSTVGGVSVLQYTTLNNSTYGTLIVSISVGATAGTVIGYPVAGAISGTILTTSDVTNTTTLNGTLSYIASA